MIELENIKRCNSCITNGGAVFLDGAKVDNSQNDPLKIIIGKDSVVVGLLLVFKYGGKISIGKNCYIGDHSRIWSGENITIGNNVLVSHNVNIIDTSAHEFDPIERAERYNDMIQNGPWKDKGSVVTAPIVIEDHVWISFNSTILRGVTIGRGAIVGAGSVVTKDVPPFTLVVGNPAKAVRALR